MGQIGVSVLKLVRYGDVMKTSDAYCAWEISEAKNLKLQLQHFLAHTASGVGLRLSNECNLALKN